jgi:hypothetical protein
MLLEDVASGYTYLLGPQSYGKGQQNCGRIVMNTNTRKRVYYSSR